MNAAARRSDLAVLGLMACWGYAAGVNGAIAPLLAASFGVGESEIASALGWIGLASLGALALARLTDRIGRRRVALAASVALAPAAIASALADSLFAYVVAQALVYACGTSLLASLTVLVAETADCEQRARAQGRAGLAFVVGTALPLVATAALAPQGIAQCERWRAVWWIAALSGVAWPLAFAWLRDAPEWHAAAPTREFIAVRASVLRRPAPVLIGASAAIATAEVAARSWLFFHAVVTLGLSPRRAFAVIAAGGFASLVGFGAGARLADRCGRRAAFLASAGLFAIGASGYFGASRDVAGDPSWLLFASFAAMGIGGNAATTAFRTHATELVPLRARGAIAGSLAVASASGWVAAMFATSALAAALGSLGFAVVAIVAVTVPTAIGLVLSLPETAHRVGGENSERLREVDVATESLREDHAAQPSQAATAALDHAGAAIAVEQPLRLG